MSSEKAQRRKRLHAKDRRLAAEAPLPLCRGFPQTLVRVMQESLMGNPMTIFVPDGSNENTGARGFRYFKAASMNADWWQDATLAKKEGGVGLDGPELQWAMQRVQTCEPLIDSRTAGAPVASGLHPGRSQARLVRGVRRPGVPALRLAGTADEARETRARAESRARRHSVLGHPVPRYMG